MYPKKKVKKELHPAYTQKRKNSRKATRKKENHVLFLKTKAHSPTKRKSHLSHSQLFPSEKKKKKKKNRKRKICIITRRKSGGKRSPCVRNSLFPLFQFIYYACIIHILTYTQCEKQEIVFLCRKLKSSLSFFCGVHSPLPLSNAEIS